MVKGRGGKLPFLPFLFHVVIAAWYDKRNINV